MQYDLHCIPEILTDAVLPPKFPILCPQPGGTNQVTISVDRGHLQLTSDEDLMQTLRYNSNRLIEWQTSNAGLSAPTKASFFSQSQARESSPAFMTINPSSGFQGKISWFYDVKFRYAIVQSVRIGRISPGFDQFTASSCHSATASRWVLLMPNP